MCKQSIIVPGRLYCGIDVSAVSLFVAVQREEQLIEEREFPNNASGHKFLITWLRRLKATVATAGDAHDRVAQAKDLKLASGDSVALDLLLP
jgi:hypothetical protein